MKSSTPVLVALFAAVVIAGCGGGGGSSSPAPNPIPAPTPAPSPSTPVPLNSGNAVDITRGVLGTSETLLALAQFAGESVQGLAAPGTASPQVFECSGNLGVPSTVTVTLTDRDGNGVASPGDRVSIRVNDCFLPRINAVARGSIDIELASAAGLAAGGVRGVMSMNSFALGPDASAPTSTLHGSAQLEWSTDEVTRTLRLSTSAADDLRVAIRSVTSTVTDAIRQPEITKSVRFDEARTSVSIAYRYDSELNGGRTVVSTPTPLLAYLNSSADVGRIELAGAGGSKIVVSAVTTSPNLQYQIALDANGDGTAEANSIRDWHEAMPLGFFFWDGLGATGPQLPSIYIRPVQSTDFYATTALRWATSSSSVVRLQFSRPLAASTPPLFFRLADSGASTFDASPRVDIGLSTERHGALFVLRPVTPLRHDRVYVLQQSLDGSTWNSVTTIQDIFGNSLSSTSWAGGFPTSTPATLLARPKTDDGALFAATDVTHLDGLASTTTGRPIVSYRWVQVAGTPLRIANPNAAQTEVSWGNVGPAGIESAVFELTVTDAAGDSDAVRLPIVSADLVGSAHRLYYRNPEGGLLAGARTAVVSEALGLFVDDRPSPGVLQMQFFGGGNTDNSALTVATANGAPLQIGAYENAGRALFAPSQNGLDFSTAARGCNQLFGRFDVLDVQTDAAGRYTVLAIDFEQRCDLAGRPPLLGSYRFNSGLPLRR